MDTIYDSKGKFFTDIITKGTVQVIVQTTFNCLQGNLHLLPDERLIDAVNRSKTFLALTDVVVHDLEDELLYQSDFLAINKDHIQWVLPLDDIENKGEGV